LKTSALKHLETSVRNSYLADMKLANLLVTVVRSRRTGQGQARNCGKCHVSLVGRAAVEMWRNFVNSQ